MKQLTIISLISFVSAIAGVSVYDNYFKSSEPTQVLETAKEELPLSTVKLPPPAYSNSPVDFRFAASRTTEAVVHVKTKQVVQPMERGNAPMFWDFFGDNLGDRFQGGGERQRSSGSGVIVTSTGYVVTNNHVVERADKIEVTLHNNKTFEAELVGTDKDTDIAVLKLDGEDFPSVRFTDSDSISIGEWVLAVGNPFNLASTVTAGIVSAKGRNLNLLENKSKEGGNTAIESFIQTDAAVNPGNSGGALVNIRGELVGINTAIATPTGTYAGYSFAVPSNLVRKVVSDLMEYGKVQRGFLGVNIRPVTDEMARELDLPAVEGVYLEGIMSGSAAQDAGLKKGDVILHINGKKVGSPPELQEEVAAHRPGDRIEVAFLRDGSQKSTVLTLKNKFNNTAIIDSKDDILDLLGLEVEDVKYSELSQLGLRGGVRIKDLKPGGKLSRYTDIKQGFIITMIDDQKVEDVDDFIEVMNNTHGNVMIEGVYPNRANSTYLYAFKM